MPGLLVGTNVAGHDDGRGVVGWFVGKCLISCPDTLRPYKQKNSIVVEFFFLWIYVH